MFDAVEIGNEISKEEFEQREPQLRVDLLNTQFDLQHADFSVLVLLMGDDRGGCHGLIGRMHEWLDARHIDTEFFGAPTEEELERPRFWRYWRALPPKGKIGLYIGAWALNTIADRVDDRITDGVFERRIGHIRQIERALAADGTLVLKLWMHLPKKELKRRLKKAERTTYSRNVEEDDWVFLEKYDDAMSIAERLVRKTDTDYAPWILVESTDDRYRDLTVMTTLQQAIAERLATVPAETTPPLAGVSVLAPRGPLSAVDLSKTIPKPKYKKELKQHQAKLHSLSLQMREQRRSAVLVFEGWDAAGKGGAIRRMTAAMSAREYIVLPIAAPTDEEKARHYLWRFWRHLPRAGRMIVFDRSWYGRVLVERVEGFATTGEWQRAYEEINDFEEQLVEKGIPVIKFWLHISAEEQAARFAGREQTPYKKYKITDEDYRNRERWDDYVHAVNDMVERTSTENAPWHLVPANDKRWARIQVIRTVCKTLKSSFGKG